jgi:DNA-binding transcriptional regulator YiaG
MKRYTVAFDASSGMMHLMSGYITKTADSSDRYKVVPPSQGDIVLREERERRRMSREELAEKSKISVIWLRRIESGQEKPGPEARERIRAALEYCPVCAGLGVKSHKLPVPDDEELYLALSAKKKSKTA